MKIRFLKLEAYAEKMWGWSACDGQYGLKIMDDQYGFSKVFSFPIGKNGSGYMVPGVTSLPKDTLVGILPDELDYFVVPPLNYGSYSGVCPSKTFQVAMRPDILIGTVDDILTLRKMYSEFETNLRLATDELTHFIRS